MEKETNFNVSITSGSVIKFFLIAICLGLLYFLRDLFLVVLTSIVIAAAIEPFTSWLREKTKLPRIPSVIVIYVIFSLTLFFLISIFLPIIFDDFFKLFSTIPAYVKSFDAFSYIGEGPAQILTTLQNRFADSFSLETLFPGIQSAVTETGGQLVSTAKNFFAGMLDVVLIFVLSFYLSAQEKGIENFLRLVTPLSYEKYILDLWERSKRKIGRWMQGQVLLGIVVGAMVFLGLSVLGVKHALALAILASILEIIPIFGPILAAIPAVILGLIQGVDLGLMVLGLFIVIQQFENHLIYPLVVRKVVGIPPLIIILFLIVGATLAGLLGAIIAVPLAVVIVEIASDFEKRKRFVNAEAEAVIARDGK